MKHERNGCKIHPFRDAQLRTRTVRRLVMSSSCPDWLFDLSRFSSTCEFTIFEGYWRSIIELQWTCKWANCPLGKKLCSFSARGRICTYVITLRANCSPNAPRTLIFQRQYAITKLALATVDNGRIILILKELYGFRLFPF